MVSCEAVRGCDRNATRSVTILAPTGETITDDTGTMPVLRAVISARLCDLCAPMLAGLKLPRGHVDVDELLPEEPDAIDAAKALEAAGFEVLSRDGDGFTALIGGRR